MSNAFNPNGPNVPEISDFMAEIQSVRNQIEELILQICETCGIDTTCVGGTDNAELIVLFERLRNLIKELEGAYFDRDIERDAANGALDPIRSGIDPKGLRSQ